MTPETVEQEKRGRIIPMTATPFHGDALPQD
jgi:hypothetical protein